MRFNSKDDQEPVFAVNKIDMNDSVEHQVGTVRLTENTEETRLAEGKLARGLTNGK